MTRAAWLAVIVLDALLLIGVAMRASNVQW